MSTKLHIAQQNLSTMEMEVVQDQDTSGPRHADIQQSAAELGIKIVRWGTVIIIIIVIIFIVTVRLAEVEKWGAARPRDTQLPGAASTAVICYSPMMAGDLRPKVPQLIIYNVSITV